jgi:hypothetical protein
MVGRAQLISPLVSIGAYGTLIAAAGEGAQERFIEFFTANIRNCGGATGGQAGGLGSRLIDGAELTHKS